MTVFFLRSRPCLPLCLSALLLLSGCTSSEPPRYKVTGQVTLNGKPLTVQPVLGQVKVQFLPFAEPSKLVDPNDATYDEKTGKFTVGGLDGKGISPGKYRVAVYQYDPYPQVDKLGGRFSKEKTPIEVEIAGPKDVSIELSQYTK